MLNIMSMNTAIMTQFIYNFVNFLASQAPDCYTLIFTNYVRMQCSYFSPSMLSILCSGENVCLILYQVVACLLDHKNFHKYYFKTFPIMLALYSMLSEIYYVQNYAGIIGLGLIAMHRRRKHAKTIFHNSCFKCQLANNSTLHLPREIWTKPRSLYR